MSKGYSTHIPMLLKTVQKTKGAVLEVGSGFFSTPLLHWLCAEKRRKLITYEVKPEYLKFAKEFQSRTHRIVSKIPKYKFDVVLIDGEQSERADLAILFKDASFVILHDSESDSYDYDRVYPHFKYRFDWKFCVPWTTVLSNTKKL